MTNMEQIKAAFYQALHHLLGEPATTFQFWFILAAAGLLFTYILHRSVESMGTRGMSFLGAVLPTAIGLGVAITGGALANIYLEGTIGYIGLLALGMVLASALVIVPVLNAIVRCGYMSLIGSWMFALAGFVLIVILVNGVFDFIESSGSVADQQQERNERQQQLIQ